MATKRTTSIPRGWQYIALGASAVVVAGMSWIALQPQAPTQSANFSSSRYVDSTPPPITREAQKVYVIGDSVTAGGTPGKGVSYAHTLRLRLNWNVEIDGAGSTGFVSKGATPKDGSPTVDASFPTRLPKIVAAHPDIVIIAGGRNDIYTGRENVADTIDAFYRDLRSQLPDAEIVTVSPWLWATSTEQQYANRVENVSGLMRAATESVGGLFFDSRVVLTPFTDADVETLLIADGFHPNDEGQERIGNELAKAFVAAGLPRGPEQWVERDAFTNDWHDPTDEFFN